MSSLPLKKELIFLVLQYLYEERLKDAAHCVERESGVFFNMKYFEEKILAGDWEEAEKYLFGFTTINENRYSTKIFFEIRKQKYLEALDRKDKPMAVEILINDLKAFSKLNEDLFKEITQLLTLSDFRENALLSKYADTQTTRSMLLMELKKLIEGGPDFRDKLIFPNLNSSRLRDLINQSLNWQHHLCKNPRSNPDVRTLYNDHVCTPSAGRPGLAPTSLPVTGLAKALSYTSPASHLSFLPTAAAVPNVNNLSSWMANAIASTSVQKAVAQSSISFPNNQALQFFKHPRTPPTAPRMVDYLNPEHEQTMKRLRMSRPIDEATYPITRQAVWSLDDLPGTLALTRHQGSVITSMDFHPSNHTLLLVGCATGEITLWEIRLRESLFTKPFNIWNDMSACSQAFQASVSSDTSVSVTHVAWSPDGSFMGIAFTKHLVHLYASTGANGLHEHIEIEAHVGRVNDLVFTRPNKKICLLTCGDDKLIKVWDLTGTQLYNFEGHEAPVYSICPNRRENATIEFLFSTDVDGKIKAWLYDGMGSKVNYDAPQHSAKMIYSADGNRLFSCGTSKEGESFLVEWSETEGLIKRTYTGFSQISAGSGIVQFDTSRNRILAAGEDSQIKFWDMDNGNMLTSTQAEGGLPSLPCLRFNKEGNLLAVSTSDNGFKILANTAGLRSIGLMNVSPVEALRQGSYPAAQKVSGSSTVGLPDSANCQVEMSSPTEVEPAAARFVKSVALEDLPDRTKPWKLPEILDPAQCKLLTLPDTTGTSCSVAQLLYTNIGTGILAIGLDGIQKLWKWQRTALNPDGKATTSAAPRHCLPKSGIPMENDIRGVQVSTATPCIAVSKNDSYILSTVGGEVSLFNSMTFAVLTTFMPPPPSSTYLLFHPHNNNVLIIGLDNSTVHVYNVRNDEIISILKGHRKRITGLAVSTFLNILVSSGADGQICSWRIENWEKRKCVKIQLPATEGPVGNIRVQFHSDLIHFLVVHASQLSVYDAIKMEQILQWVPNDDLSAPISQAAYSCNGKLIYATFCDGNIGVFDVDTLRPRCRIAPSVFLSREILNRREPVHPIAIAANPVEPNQFAVGLVDGSIEVIEPVLSDGEWGSSPPADSGTTNDKAAPSSSTTSKNTPDQDQRM